MAQSPDSMTVDVDTFKESPPTPSPPSNSHSPPSSPPTQLPSTPDSSAPPPTSKPSPPPPQKSPPPPPPPPPPKSPPPLPPPLQANVQSPPPPPSKSSPSPPPPESTDSPTMPSPLPKEEWPTLSRSSEPSQPSQSSASPSNSSHPANNSQKSENSLSLTFSSPPPQSSPSSSMSPPAQSLAASLSSIHFSPPAPVSQDSSPPASDSSPSPPTQSSTLSWTTIKSPSTLNTSTPNVTLNSIVNTPTPTPNHPQESLIRLGIAFGIVAAVLVITIFLAILFVYKRRKKRKLNNSMYIVPPAFAPSPDPGYSLTKQSPNGGHPSPDTHGIGISQTWFSYEDLAAATDGFDSQNIIGSGGFGCVYKGFLQNGKEVAIKKLKDKSGQGDREFRAEVEIISRVHHRHLVILVGFCIFAEQRLLVYEFVPNNTLYHHLHSANKPPMNWAPRVKVACGSARGIAYLHEDCSPRIIHRDIKSPNILLTRSFEAKVADFGLAKLAQELESDTHVSTRVMGTFGYMAPEYATSGKLTEKSDVFSFGVVLLELITGRKPVDDTRSLGDESLVEWARPLMSEALDTQNFDELADSRLEGDYDRGEMFRMIEAAAACVRHSAMKRPRMSQVVRALDTMGDLSNGITPGDSVIMDSREQSVQIRMFERMTFESQDYSVNAGGQS